ncbi:MAG: hypothetical protein DWP97_10025 [Calditrichaeota bacterium]|nr:MAG: hypothetical protein DWP97_10025 [Calditrichota bacterium]
MKIILKSIFLIIVIARCSFGISPAERAIKIEPVEKEYATYFYSNPSYIEKSDSVLIRTRDRLILMLRDSLDYKPKLYLLDDLSQFNNLTAGKIPDWGAAVAYSARKLIAIKSPDKFNTRKSVPILVAHEYTHLAIADKCGFHDPPRWMHEGLSVFLSEEWSWSDNLAMGKAAVFGQFIPLADIDNVNRFNESKAQIAYAESYLAVKFMLRYYGSNSVNLFLTRIGEGKTVDEALYSSTGLTVEEFQTDFNAYLNQQFNFVSIFMDTIFFWIALAIIMVVGFFLQFKKRRKYYKKWEEQEKLQSTDFDYGDPDNPEHIEDDDEPWRS